MVPLWHSSRTRKKIVVSYDINYGNILAVCRLSCMTLAMQYVATQFSQQRSVSARTS